MSTTLNGWTAARLDALANDVAGIKKAIEDMRSEEITDLKAQIRSSRTSARATITAYLAPLLAGLIPAIVILLHG